MVSCGTAHLRILEGTLDARYSLVVLVPCRVPVALFMASKQVWRPCSLRDRQSASGLWSRKTQNLGPNSRSRYLKHLVSAPKSFGPLKTEKHCVICTTRLPHKLGLWNRNTNFGLRLQHLKIFGSGSRTIFWSTRNWKPLFYLHNPITPQILSVEQAPKFRTPALPSKSYWLINVTGCRN